VVKRKGVTQQQVQENEKTPSNGKEEREVVTCIRLPPSNTTFTLSLSLSFTLMPKLKLEEEGNYNNYNS